LWNDLPLSVREGRWEVQGKVSFVDGADSIQLILVHFERKNYFNKSKIHKVPENSSSTINWCLVFCANATIQTFLSEQFQNKIELHTNFSDDV
jgi:hypothetical protein